MDAVNWFWHGLLLAFVALRAGQGIQVSPKPTGYNSTASLVNSEHHNGTVFMADTVISASERTRRLIPYMAFYLPPDFPINQQYSVQRPKQGHESPHQPPPTAAESAGPLPPGHIPVPPAYMQTRVPPPIAATTPIGIDLPYSPHPQPHHYQPSAGEVYHTMAYSDQHPTGLSKAAPVLHLLPPGPPGPSAGAAAGSGTTYKEVNVHKHKTVQHFPPTAPSIPLQTQAQSHDAHYHHDHYHQQHQLQPLQQQQHQQQLLPKQGANRPHPKQPKVNLTPFTPSNTLPGHFVPIIYTPVNSDGGSGSGTDSDTNNNYQPSGNMLKYTYDGATVVVAEGQTQQQQHYKNYHNTQQQQKVAVEYPQPPTDSDAAVTVDPQQHRQYHHQSQQQLSQQVQQYNGITGASPPSPTPTGPVIGTHSTASPIYHAIHDSSQSLTSTLPHKQSLVASKHSQSQPQYRHKHPHFHAPQPEPFFDNDENQQQQQHLQPTPSRPQQQYFDEDNMTPQEKYVRYLQQRIRYNKQRQKQHAQEREQFAKQQKQQHFQQHSPIYVTVGTAAPLLESVSQQHNVPSADPLLNYPQHSPIRHAVYPHPELHVPANHQPPNAVSTKQVLHIPVRTLVNAGLDVLKQQTKGDTVTYRKLVKQHHKSLGSPKTKYADHIIDEPKQSLDEEQPPNRTPTKQKHHKPIVSSPQAAYIVITTPAPYAPTTSSANREHYISTERPAYIQQSTLRLQPATYSQYPTRRPSIVTSDRSPVSATPKYFYSSNKPGYFEVLTQSPVIKLRPSYKYETTPSAVKEYASTAAPPPQQLEQQHPHSTQVTLRPLETAPQNQNYQNGMDSDSHNTAALPVDPNQLPDIRSSSLAEILHKLQASNHLPQTLTPENIDNSIKTLVTILNNLKQTQTVVANPPQHHDTPPTSADYDYTTASEEKHGDAQDLSVIAPVIPNKHPGPSTGRPGIDYPNYAEIPRTSFDCAEQRYKGFFGDPETNCQVWHYCDLNGGKASFLCPNGTIFSQIALTCDWWFNVKCSTTAQLYVLNERLYKYILPFTPKFPEDYSGPLVDKYLAMKFQEMEEKMRLEKEKAAQLAPTATTTIQPNNHLEEEITIPDADSVTQSPKHQSVNSQVGEQSSERNLLIDDEVDDISQRGSVDTFEDATQTTAAPQTTSPPLSLKPIVVSSTSGPDYEDSSSEDQQILQNTRNAEDTQKVQSNKEQVAQPNRSQQPTEKGRHEMTKITVEKVEVIEIKPDGATGHLLPEMLFNADDKAR